MDPFDLSPLVGLAVFAAALALWRLRTARRRLAFAISERDRARTTEDATARLLRHSGTELRATSLMLLGHVERLRMAHRASAGQADVIASITAQLLDLSDDLQDHHVPPATSRVLHVEPLRLHEPVEGAIAAVNAALGPGQRRWTVDPELSELRVLADRRALKQVFLSVLGHAARFSRHDDRIVVAVVPEGGGGGSGGLTVIVANAELVRSKGTTSLTEAVSHADIGLGLGLARVLMQAHGGELTAVMGPRPGVHVTLSLPAWRVDALQPQSA